MDRYGADGYLVFFGVLEIYSREFKHKDDWKLNVTRSYLRQKLHKRQDTIIIKCLKYIATNGLSLDLKTKLTVNSWQTRGKLVANSQQTRDELVMNSKKVYQNSGKWDIAFNGEQVIIFIPKFTEIIDEWTKRKLRSDSEDAPKILKAEAEAEGEEEGEEDISLKGKGYKLPPCPQKKNN